METTKDQESLLNILPPRPEDAGLEDCALPPDLIKQAFFKAASAVKSRATSIFSDGDEEAADCVQDPWPDTAKGYSDEVVGDVQPESAGADVLVGVENEKEASGTCVVEKGSGLVEEGGDKVVVVDDEGCVSEGLEGLKIGEGNKKTAVNGGDDADGEEKGDGEKPTLTEGFV